MADGMYVGMSGAVARAQELDSVADNLANATSNGFKRSQPVFQAVLGEGHEDQLAHVAAMSTGTDLRPGATVETGNPTDVIPDEGAFFTVATGPGALAYTRNGRLQTDSNGTLRIGRHLVLDQQGAPISAPPGVPVTIDARGMVSSGGTEIAQLGFVKLIGTVDRLGEGLLRPGIGGGAVPAEVRVRTGELELSNANPLESAVQMITAQRHFESSMQAIQTYKKLDDRANELGKVR